MKIYIIVNGHISNLLVIKRWRSGSLQPFEPSYSLCARHRFSSNVASVFRMGPWVIDCCLTSRLWWCLLWTHGWIGPHYTGVTCSSISTYFPGFKITSFYPYLLMLLASPKAAKIDCIVLGLIRPGLYPQVGFKMSLMTAVNVRIIPHPLLFQLHIIKLNYTNGI